MLYKKYFAVVMHANAWQLWFTNYYHNHFHVTLCQTWKIIYKIAFCECYCDSLCKITIQYLYIQKNNKKRKVNKKRKNERRWKCNICVKVLLQKILSKKVKIVNIN